MLGGASSPLRAVFVGCIGFCRPRRLLAAVRMSTSGADGIADDPPSDIWFWLVTAVLFLTVFGIGMVFGGWMTWRFLVKPVVAVSGLQQGTQAQKEEELSPPAPQLEGQELYLTPAGERYHVKAVCFGLRGASGVKVKTPCKLCVKLK
jgi:hypothetical protein